MDQGRSVRSTEFSVGDTMLSFRIPQAIKIVLRLQQVSQLEAISHMTTTEITLTKCIIIQPYVEYCKSKQINQANLYNTLTFSVVLYGN